MNEKTTRDGVYTHILVAGRRFKRKERNNSPVHIQPCHVSSPFRSNWTAPGTSKSHCRSPGESRSICCSLIYICNLVTVDKHSLFRARREQMDLFVLGFHSLSLSLFFFLNCVILSLLIQKKQLFFSGVRKEHTLSLQKKREDNLQDAVNVSSTTTPLLQHLGRLLTTIL